MESKSEERQFGLELTGNFTARYFLRQSEKPPKADASSPLVLLLHGFAQSGSSILKKLDSAIPANAIVVSPNGPFPVPERTADGYRTGYSWYFYESRADEYYVDMKLAVTYLARLIEHINRAEQAGSPNREIIVAGYSQGGYLAPFAAEKIRGVKRVITLNAQLLDEEISGKLPFEMISINGAEDEIVDPAAAEKSCANLRSRGMSARFEKVAGVGHALTPELISHFHSYFQ